MTPNTFNRAAPYRAPLKPAFAVYNNAPYTSSKEEHEEEQRYVVPVVDSRAA